MWFHSKVIVGTINNTHNLWWLNQEPSICPLDRVQSPPSDNVDLRKNHNAKFRLVQKLYGENIHHVNITKPIKIQFFIHLTSFVAAILVKSYCFTSPFVPNPEAKSVVPVLTTRDSEHCWRSLLVMFQFDWYDVISKKLLLNSGHCISSKFCSDDFWEYTAPMVIWL